MSRSAPHVHPGFVLCSFIALSGGGCGEDNGSAPAPIDITGSWQQNVESQVHADAVGWMNKRLLAIGGYPQRLLELDPATFRATRTYEELDPDLEVLGLAAAGDRLFILAWPPRSSQAVIVEVAP